MVLLQQLSFFQQILHADYALMLKINKEWQWDVFDTIALFIREATFWVPLYIFIVLFASLNFGKKGIWWILALVCLVSLSDIISSHVIKVWLFRPRPCRDPFMAHQIRFLAKTCGMNGSFTSSHATNHFTIASFLYFTLKRFSPWWAVGFLWAGLIAYAQVYVGVHYPFDIIGGAILGFATGYLGARIFIHQMGNALTS